MNINGVNNQHQTNFNPYRKAMEQQPQKDNPQKRDQVEISDQAKRMQQDSQIDVQRQEKIEALKLQIESGNYQVDAKKIAEKFHQFWTGQ